MRVAGRMFECLGELAVERNHANQPLEFEVHTRYKRAALESPHSYGLGPFCKFRLLSAKVESGVYLFVVNDEIVYVGETVNLKTRFAGVNYGAISPKNCYRGGQPTNCRLNNLVLVSAKEGNSVEIWFHACSDHKEFEREVLAELKSAHRTPRWNR